MTPAYTEWHGACRMLASSSSPATLHATVLPNPYPLSLCLIVGGQCLGSSRGDTAHAPRRSACLIQILTTLIASAATTTWIIPDYSHPSEIQVSMGEFFLPDALMAAYGTSIIAAAVALEMSPLRVIMGSVPFTVVLICVAKSVWAWPAMFAGQGLAPNYEDQPSDFHGLTWWEDLFADGIGDVGGGFVWFGAAGALAVTAKHYVGSSVFVTPRHDHVTLVRACVFSPAGPVAMSLSCPHEGVSLLTCAPYGCPPRAGDRSPPHVARLDCNVCPRHHAAQHESSHYPHPSIAPPRFGRSCDRSTDHVAVQFIFSHSNVLVAARATPRKRWAQRGSRPSFYSSRAA